MLAADWGSGLRGRGSLLLRQEVVAAHGQVVVSAQGEAAGDGLEAEFAGHVLNPAACVLLRCARPPVERGDFTGSGTCTVQQRQYCPRLCRQADVRR